MKTLAAFLVVLVACKSERPPATSEGRAVYAKALPGLWAVKGDADEQLVAMRQPCDRWDLRKLLEDADFRADVDAMGFKIVRCAGDADGVIAPWH